MYKHLFQALFSVLLGTGSAVGLLDHMVNLCSIVGETAILLPQGPHHSTFPPAVHRGPIPPQSR